MRTRHITWKLCTIRTCVKGRQCILCRGVLTRGEKYYESSHNRFNSIAHLACGDVADRGESVPRRRNGPREEVAVLEPHVLPVQFFTRPNVYHEGERRLLLAILEDAIETLEHYHGSHTKRARRLTAETLTWVTAEDWSWPFSFVNICAYLDFASDTLRLRLTARYGRKGDLACAA